MTFSMVLSNSIFYEIKESIKFPKRGQLIYMFRRERRDILSMMNHNLRFNSSAILCSINWEVVTDVSEEFSASIFRVYII
jgi:hypothetical protein